MIHLIQSLNKDGDQTEKALKDWGSLLEPNTWGIVFLCIKYAVYAWEADLPATFENNHISTNGGTLHEENSLTADGYGASRIRHIC